MLRRALLRKEGEAQKERGRLPRGGHDAHGEGAEPPRDGAGEAAPKESRAGEGRERHRLAEGAPGGVGPRFDLRHGPRGEQEGEAVGHVTREDGDGSHGDEGDGVEVEDELVLSHVVRFHDLFTVCGEDRVAAQGGDQHEDSDGGKDGAGLGVGVHENDQPGRHETDSDVLRDRVAFLLANRPGRHGKDDPAGLDHGFGGIVEMCHGQVGESEVERPQQR
mmetsp:Transcript_17294/g.34413  ORF Transcript_17294/g.34413 Transcript_17294/m.34413 type:complete len:220 (-) Transcript_17294:474-1133(-)